MRSRSIERLSCSSRPSLDDPLNDVKGITQTVGYAANDGVEWCVLSNGVLYKVYRSSEKAAAPEKLLFEVSLDPRDPQALTTDQVADQLARLSRASLAGGVLDQLGEEVFTTGKVRKALDRLFADPPAPFIRAVRRALGNESVAPSEVRKALTRIWGSGAQPPRTSGGGSATKRPAGASASAQRGDGRQYQEAHHTSAKPKEVVELYRALDRICQNLAPGQISRRYLAKYVSWSLGKWIFAVHTFSRAGCGSGFVLTQRQFPIGPASPATSRT